MADIAILPKSQRQGVVFEQCHVQQVYDEIASRVNDIQHKAWPNVKRFLKKFEIGSLVADIGCGNGRYLNINKGVYKVGIDVCKAMVDNSRLKRFEVAYADNLHVPFRDGMFDGVISIGVIHHFCSSERRIQALKELARLLAPGGKLMLYVWAYEQKHRKFDSQDVLIPWHEHRTHRIRIGSASSRTSSLGAMSSNSSISDDDNLEQGNQSTTNGNQSNLPQLGGRNQSSSSLDDMTSVMELSNFKPSYYSLDFTRSPYHRNKGDGVHPVDDLSMKGNVVSECQKLEASLRAMSLGSLEELLQVDDNDLFREKGRLDVNVSNLSKEKCFQDEDKKNSLTFEQCKKGLSGFTDGIEDPQKSRLAEAGCKFDLGEPREYETIVSDTPKCSKINPFLKKNSFDEYTFNKVLQKKPSNEDFDIFLEVDETMNDTDSLDEVFVNFAPHKKEEKDTGQSLITSIKSKLMKIFNDESDGKKEKVKKTGRIGSLNRHLSEDSLRTTRNTRLSSAEQKRANKLGFKVREFPQSSCPDLADVYHGRQTGYQEQSYQAQVRAGYIIQDSDNSPTSRRRSLQGNLDNSPSSHKSLRGNLDNSPSSQHKSLHGNFDNSPSSRHKSLHSNLDKSPSRQKPLHGNITQTHSTSVSTGSTCLLNKQVDTAVTDVRCVCVRQQSMENEFLGEIYDGYIKIDLVNSSKQSQQCAFNEATDAKTNGALGDHIDNCDSMTINGWCTDEGEMYTGGNNDLIANTTNGNRCNTDNEIELENNGDLHKSETDSTLCLGFSKDVSDRNIDRHLQSTHVESQEDGGTGDSDFSSKLCRYYHVFREGELESLIGNHVKGLRILQSCYDHANWCIIAEKCTS